MVTPPAPEHTRAHTIPHREHREYYATQHDLDAVIHTVDTSFGEIHKEIAWLKRHVQLVVCLMITMVAVIISNSAGHGPAGWRVVATILAAMAITAAWEYLYQIWR